MKYWTGYLTAAILLACSWALRQFAKAHTVLVDMIYPYVSRMAQSFLADWSSGVDFCLWQALVYVLLALIAAVGVLVVVFKWNPIRWGGWVCAALAVLVFLNTGLYGLNQFAGPLSEDIRLEETDYTVSELKKLSWAGAFTARGITGMTVGLTGEAAVNPRIPQVMLPFAMCREMAHQSGIAIERDAAFASYLACMNHSDPTFQYSGALMGYRYCLMALEALDAVTDAGAVARVKEKETGFVKLDLKRCDDFLGQKEREDAEACDLLVSWHIQEVILPTLVEEEELFNPMDKNQVDLSDHPDA